MFWALLLYLTVSELAECMSVVISCWIFDACPINVPCSHVRSHLAGSTYAVVSCWSHDACPTNAPCGYVCSELAESIRAELAGYVKGRTDEILNISNRVARLKKELEKHEGEAMVQVRLWDSPLVVFYVGDETAVFASGTAFKSPPRNVPHVCVCMCDSSFCIRYCLQIPQHVMHRIQGWQNPKYCAFMCILVCIYVYYA